MAQRYVAAKESSTVFQRVCNLTVADVYLAVGGEQTISLTIVYGAPTERKRRTVYARRVAHNAIVGRVNIGKFYFVVVTRRIEMNALPLSAHTVVRQIVEYVIQTVAPKRNNLVGCSCYFQLSVHIYACLIGKIKRGSSTNGKRCALVHLNASLHYNGLRALYGGIVLYLNVLQEFGVPAVSLQVYFLLHRAFERKHEVVFHQLWVGLAILRRCKLYKDTNTVLVSHLKPIHLISVCLSQVDAVYIDSETRLVALLQPNIGKTNAIARPVVDPKCLCGGRNFRESSVKAHRIC